VTVRTLLLLSLVLPMQTGCYYGHLASGQWKLLWRRQPIDVATANDATPERTRALLRLVGSVRGFATELGLDVGGQYTSYVDWPGDRVVTTLVRTRPPSLEPVPWHFPLVGELPYKGYFDRARAEAEAARLRDEEGFDVCVSPVVAYSTLGWFDDPVTSPMLALGRERLVETLLHEFVHATAFLPDATDWNESVAQFIGEQAALRFFERHGDASTDATEAERYRAYLEDRWTIDARIEAFRDQLMAMGDAPDRARRRAAAERATRAELAALPLRQLDPDVMARVARLSDACLALRGTYVADRPRHAAVLAALGGDLPAMIARLSRWAEEERPPEAFYEVGGAGRSTADGASGADRSGGA
jgi:predicted aminopeptidase